MYLITVEDVDVKKEDLSLSHSLFATKQTAQAKLEELRNIFGISASKEFNDSGWCFEDKDENEVIFYIQGTPIKDRHIKLSIEEIECQEIVPVSLTDFVKSEISDIFEVTTEKNPEDYKELIDNLTDLAIDNEPLWEDFNADLMTIMDNEPDYRKLAEEYDERCYAG